VLAILSDLHFCDATAIEANVNPAAFELALRDVYDDAAALARRQDRPVHLDLVLLGDVFDLLRTERWFEDPSRLPVPLSERPWGTAAALTGAAPPAAVLGRAHGILDEIVSANAAALATLRGASSPPPAGVEVRRILLTGNHDRLCLHDPALLARMREALGAVDERTLAAEGIHPHRIEMPAYGLLARHGHEWDGWNFEPHKFGLPASEYVDDDYLPTPIGDAITTELAARLPYELGHRLADSTTLTPEEKLTIRSRMQRIEDVRPLLASLSWAYYEAGRLHGVLGEAKAREVRVALDATVRSIVEGFRKLDFYKAWLERHHRALRLDAPQLLRALLDGLAVVNVETIGKLGALFERAMGADGRDPYRAGAAREDLRAVAQKGLRYVVYGHTHDPAHAALHAGPSVQDTYLNSGTFRQRVFHTDDRQGFITSEHMTYLCFFTEQESVHGWSGRGPAYAAWTGTRSR
jgi:UDP-2,3-diacylglucosamine pyrophosphatase LpxH